MLSSRSRITKRFLSVTAAFLAVFHIVLSVPACAPDSGNDSPDDVIVDAADYTVNVYYLQNDARRAELNAAGVDYTPAYIPALLAWLGASGTPCTAADLANLGENDILLANRNDLDTIPENVGYVILLGGGDVVRAPEIVGHLLYGEERIPLFAPITAVTDAAEVLYMGENESGESVPAVVRQDERTYSFCFDLCATVWFSGDGFSDGEGKNGFPVGRTPDTRPVPSGMYSDQPYNDHLLLILEDMLHSMGVPMVARLPLTEEGTYPDFALHVGGDDDYTSTAYNLTAAKVASKLGLPYHINVMPQSSDFKLDKFQMEDIAELGCELGLHTNFLEVPYTSRGQNLSVKWFKDCFGTVPVVNVNHCFIQKEMVAEKLRWLSEAGVLADNSKCGEIDPSNINAFNLCGFGFGTSFPRYTCDDTEHENQLISCMEIPINYYEPRFGGSYTDASRILNYITGAVEEGRIAGFFVHPHYFYAGNPDTEWALSALRMAMAFWDVNGYEVCLLTIDDVARFWDMRKDVQITAQKDGFVVDTETPMALSLPGSVTSVSVDGADGEIITRTVSGRERKYVVLPEAGQHTITVNN